MLLERKRKSEKKRVNYFAVPGMADYALTRLLYIVAEETGVDAAEIRSKDQSRRTADARHLFNIVARERFGHPYQLLADFLCRTSHSTIKRSESQAMNYVETDGEFRRAYERIKHALVNQPEKEVAELQQLLDQIETFKTEDHERIEPQKELLVC